MGLGFKKPNAWGRYLKHVVKWLAFIAARLWQEIVSCLARRRPETGKLSLADSGKPEIPISAVAQGVRGDPMVVAAQSYLYILGFPLGKAGPNHNGVDGTVGPITRASLAAFQKMIRIGGNGGLDLLTSRELKRACVLGLTIRDLARKAAQNGVKVEIPSNATTADFVIAVYYYALIDETETKVPAAVTTAQAILETNYGRQTPTDLLTGKCSYNLFGVKGRGPAGFVTCWTKELDQATGNWVRTVAQYKAYHSLAESIQNYTRQWEADSVASDTPSPECAGADPFVFVTRLARDGKIPDRQYAANLMQIMTDWGFT